MNALHTQKQNLQSVMCLNKAYSMFESEITEISLSVKENLF